MDFVDIVATSCVLLGSALIFLLDGTVHYVGGTMLIGGFLIAIAAEIWGREEEEEE